MHRLSLSLLAFIGCCLISQTAAAQDAAVEIQELPRPDDAPLRFDHLTVDDGLSQKFVFSIVQDRHGFMWFGTLWGGLNRYDGYTFKVYQHDPNDPGSLLNGQINALLEDDNGMLWVGYSDGLSRFDPGTETFTHYRHDNEDPQSLSGNFISTLLEDRTGVIWIGTEAGLDRL